MNVKEITGQPCCGKSSYIAKEARINNKIESYKVDIPKKILIFFHGINYLGYRRSKVLLLWSLKEKVPIFFRINIFRNAVSKFGIFNELYKSNPKHHSKIVDEGLSHLPFLFLKTHTKDVLDFISYELREISVNFLKSPGHEILQGRLMRRGHKRLQFITITSFVERNTEIEEVLLDSYPDLCNEFKVFEYAENI